MGRGGGQQLEQERPSTITARGRRRPPAPAGPTVRPAQVWQSRSRAIGDRRSQLTIIEQVAEWAHLGLLARDRSGRVCSVQPQTLARDYQLTSDPGDEVPAVDYSPPQPGVRKAKPLADIEHSSDEPASGADDRAQPQQLTFEQMRSGPPMTPAQRRYLAALCDEAGEPFDDGLSKAGASQEIDRLRRMLNARDHSA